MHASDLAAETPLHLLYYTVYIYIYSILSSTSAFKGRAYLIVPLLVTLWRLFGGRYLFVAETLLREAHSRLDTVVL